jgi:hypothetical protein
MSYQFAYKPEEYDSIMSISIKGNTREEIMKGFHFDLEGYTIYSTIPDVNFETITRTYLFKKIDSNESKWKPDK